MKLIARATVLPLALAVLCPVRADEEPPAKPEGTRPAALAALANGGVAVVDAGSGRLVKKIGGLSGATFGIVVNPANPAQAWATGEKTGQLFEIDLSRGMVTGAPIALASDPAQASTHQPVTTADGKFVLVTVPGDDTLTIVATATRAVSKVPIHHDPHIVDIDRATGHVFVSRRGAARGATFLDFEKLRARFDLATGVTLTRADLDALRAEKAYLAIPISGAPRVVTALGKGRFAMAMYGKRGPLVYEVKAGKARLVDDLDGVLETRPREPKANLEYLEAQAVSEDGRTLVGTDQGIPPYLRVWDMDEQGRAVRERKAIALPAEPYWVNLSGSGRTAYVSIPKHRDASGLEVTGRVLAIDVETGKIRHSVAIADAPGTIDDPKRMVVVELPARFLEAM